MPLHTVPLCRGSESSPNPNGSNAQTARLPPLLAVMCVGTAPLMPALL